MSDENSVPATPRRRYLPLLHRVAGVNAILLVLAVGVTIVVLDPTRVSSFRVDAEIALLVVLLAVAVALNVYILRRIVGPVQTLTALARRVDLTADGERMPLSRDASEAGELALTFNEMLDRLEAERRDATGRVLAGQEAERLRIAQELHDQVGQELTAVLLGLGAGRDARARGAAGRCDRGAGGGSRQPRGRAADRDRAAAGGARRPRARERARRAVRAVRRTHRAADHAAGRSGAPELSPEVELVVYRVAQEALTNVARHSGADEAELDLEHGGGLLTLTVERRRTRAAGRRRGRDRDARDARARDADRRAPHDRTGVRGGRLPGQARVALGERAMTPLKTRVLLADDHALVRRGLRLVLDAEPDLEVVAEAGDGAEAIERALAPEVDLAVLDITMPRMTGLQAARELHRRRPELRILMLSMHQNERYLYEALKAGASGYVLKTVADRDLVEACRAAMRGEKFLYPGAMTPLIRDLLDSARDDAHAARGPAHPARDRDRQADRRELQHQADRRGARDQREDRRSPPHEHPREARDARSRRAHPLRDPPRARRALTRR